MGMGLELSLILGIMGTVWTGNPLSLNPGFSIGGTVPGDGSGNILGNLVGLLGTFIISDSYQHCMLMYVQASLVVCKVLTTGLNPMHPSLVTTCMSLVMPGQ